MQIGSWQIRSMSRWTRIQSNLSASSNFKVRKGTIEFSSTFTLKVPIIWTHLVQCRLFREYSNCMIQSVSTESLWDFDTNLEVLSLKRHFFNTKAKNDPWKFMSKYWVHRSFCLLGLTNVLSKFTSVILTSRNLTLLHHVHDYKMAVFKDRIITIS